MTTRSLASALLSLRTEEEVDMFLSDICTASERERLGRRFDIASRLFAEQPYRVITSATGASSTTVAYVSKWLHWGTGGLRTALKRLPHSASYYDESAG